MIKSWPTKEGKFFYEHPVRITPADIDENDHVNNVVYIRWVQEAAIAHWLSAVPADLAESTVWVVMKHEIEYKKPSFLHENLVVQTWVEKGTALTSERHCRIMRQQDDALVAQVKTIWCAVNPHNGKPKRLDPRVMDIFLRQVIAQPGGNHDPCTTRTR